MNSWKNGCHHELSASFGSKAILAVWSSSNLSSSASTSYEEWETDGVPCERHFSENPFQGLWFHFMQLISTILNLCAPVTWPVLHFWLRSCYIFLANFISFLLIYTFMYWSLICLELYKNFQQAMHALLQKQLFLGLVHVWVLSDKCNKLIQFLNLYLVYIYTYFVMIWSVLDE